jgi:hypothetical protein
MSMADAIYSGKAVVAAPRRDNHFRNSTASCFDAVSVFDQDGLVHSDRSLKRRVTALTAGIGKTSRKSVQRYANNRHGLVLGSTLRNDEEISTASSGVATFAIPTNEQRVIADEAHDVLKQYGLHGSPH